MPNARQLTIVIKNVIAGLVLSATLVSCATTVRTGTAKSMEIYGPGVIHRPVMVDLDVREERVSATKTFTSSTPYATAKNEVINQALKDSHADVLISPTFDSEKIGSRFQITVHGFPATYKNFRPMQADDVPLLQAGVLQQAKAAEPVVTDQPRKKGGGAIAAVVLIVLLTVGLLASGAAGI